MDSAHPDFSLFSETPRNQVVEGPSLFALTKLLECPACSEVAIPPVFSCRVGHNICKSCKKGFHFCPVCVTGFLLFRNIVAEQILDNCVLICKNNGEGCLFVDRGGGMSNHEDQCDFRPVQCPKCHKEFSYSQFMPHLEMEIESPIVMDNSGRWTQWVQLTPRVNPITGELTCICCCKWLRLRDRHFFFRVETDAHGMCYWVFVSLFGTDTAVSQWKTRFLVSNDDERVHLSYEGPVTSARSDGIAAFKAGFCLTLLPQSYDTIMKGHRINVDLTIIPSIEEFEPIPVPDLQKEEDLEEEFYMTVSEFRNESGVEVIEDQVPEQETLSVSSTNSYGHSFDVMAAILQNPAGFFFKAVGNFLEEGFMTAFDWIDGILTQFLKSDKSVKASN